MAATDIDGEPQVINQDFKSFCNRCDCDDKGHSCSNSCVTDPF